jgi:ketosteroid isomerase-like protein
MQSFYESIARGDLAAGLRLLHPQIEFRIPKTLPYGGIYHGREGFQAYVAGALAHLEPDDFLEAYERVVVLGRLLARARSSETKFTARFAHVWTLRDGLATRFDDYIDTATILAALGPSATR